MTEQELKQAMKDIVNTWWNRLTNDQKTAVKLLKFNPPVVGSMVFFNGETANGFVIRDYMDFCKALENHGLGQESYSAGVNWKYYHSREKKCKEIEDNLRNNKLIRKLPSHLQEQVVDNLRQQDVCWKECWNTNIAMLKNVRKKMLWNAIAELRKEVEG